MMTKEMRPGRRARLYGACGGAALLAVCLCGAASLAAVNAYTAVTPAMGLSASVCLGVTTTPALRAGISWHLPISSYLPSLGLSPWKVCAALPSGWLQPFLPGPAGQWLFPP